mmetsp:Transcript_65289/g.146768  ORF Transcript_65289/g.146768 Transcript_65289/m.146768 type:complete len:265 (-) Transcript_65289:568-1362(-)
MRPICCDDHGLVSISPTPGDANGAIGRVIEEVHHRHKRGVVRCLEHTSEDREAGSHIHAQARGLRPQHLLRELLGAHLVHVRYILRHVQVELAFRRGLHGRAYPFALTGSSPIGMRGKVLAQKCICIALPNRKNFGIHTSSESRRKRPHRHSWPLNLHAVCASLLPGHSTFLRSLEELRYKDALRQLLAPHIGQLREGLSLLPELRRFRLDRLVRKVDALWYSGQLLPGFNGLRGKEARNAQWRRNAASNLRAHKATCSSSGRK